jgi:hypothetical protein
MSSMTGGKRLQLLRGLVLCSLAAVSINSVCCTSVCGGSHCSADQVCLDASCCAPCGSDCCPTGSICIKDFKGRFRGCGNPCTSDAQCGGKLPTCAGVMGHGTFCQPSVEDYKRWWGE